MTFYPWHDPFRERILQQQQSDKLAHALLFSGPEYLGKFDFAVALSHLFLCTERTAEAKCGQCSACLLLEAGTHPDFRLVQPEDSKQIKIDQIRDLIGWVNQTAQRGGLKIAILNPAQQMNHQSANALLKCLEEPSSNTLIFLITSRPGSLLPTIRSRCQQYAFHTPDNQVAVNWLKSEHPEITDSPLILDIAGGLPLAVVNKFDADFLKRRQLVVKTFVAVLVQGMSPVDAAAKVFKHELEEILDILLGLLTDCVKYKLTDDKNIIKNKDLVSEVGQVVPVCSSEFLFSAIDRVTSDLRVVRGTTNPNKSLLIESLLIDFGKQQSRAIAEYSL